MIPAFVRDLASHGERIALTVTGEPPVTYADLARRTATVAARLAGPKRLVAIEAAATVPAIATYLGAIAAGHAVALLPAGDADAMRRFCERFRPEISFRRIGGRWRLLADRPADDIRPNAELALVMMTSGSTGHGKGVRLSGLALHSNAAAIADYLELKPDDHAALVLPLHYSYGLSVLNSHLAAGASVWLHQGSVLAPDFLQDLARAGCTSLAGVPHSYALLERIGLGAAHLPRLRTMTVAGGALDPGSVAYWHAHMSDRGGRFFVMYGQTEATARMAYLPPGLAGDAPDRIGHAIPGGHLFLRGRDGRRIDKPGKEGELIYRGPNVMMGYASCRADLARPTEVGDLATGDLAVRDTDGLYRIVGRLHRMSKIAGIRVGHDAVEAALAAKGIEVAVTGDDHCLTAACTPAHDPATVAAHVASVTGLTMRHVSVRCLPDLPRLSSGKIDYAELRRPAERPASAAGIAEVFRQCFHPRPVRSDDSFASLGGNSLRHVELSMEIERLSGFLPCGWERMSIADLAAQQPAPAGQAPQRIGIGTDLLIRALAILAVVVQHQTLWPSYGGAAAMVVLIGFGLGRFQTGVMASGDLTGLLRPLWRVLVPYYLILVAYALAWGRVPWASVILIGNFGFADPVRQDMLPYLYWFVEAYAQLLLVFAGLALLPSVRRLIGVAPFRFGMVLLAATCLLRIVGPELWPLGGRQIFTLPWIFYLAALGWCAATADTPARRLAVLLAALVVMPSAAFLGGNWYGAWIKYSAQFGVVAALLYLPFVTLPAAAGRVILVVARGSFLIYLLHRFVPELVMEPLVSLLPGPVFDLMAILGGVALGLTAALAARLMPDLRSFRLLVPRRNRPLPG